MGSRLRLAWYAVALQYIPLTNSLSLARAGNRVGGESLCLSMPSNTRTNLCFTLLVALGTRLFRSFPSSTTNCARLSQRPIVPAHSTAFATAPTVCSSKCLAVMHSALLTIANCRMSSSVSSSPSPVEANASRTPFIMALLPVASRPYKTKFIFGAAWV